MIPLLNLRFFPTPKIQVIAAKMVFIAAAVLETDNPIRLVSP